MTNTKTMDFLPTLVKTGNAKSIKNKMGTEVLNNFSVGQMFWHLAKRYKFGLVTVWAVLITISYIFPPFWDILGTLVR